MTTQSIAPATPVQQEQPWENLFGVCAAVGEDLGFNPMWLRIAVGVGVLVNPVGAAIVYAWMALAVLASRLLFPKPKAAVRMPAVTPLAAVSNSVPSEPQHALPLAA